MNRRKYLASITGLIIIGNVNYNNSVMAADINFNTIQVSEVTEEKIYEIQLSLNEFEITPKRIGENVELRDIKIRGKTNTTNFESSVSIYEGDKIKLESNSTLGDSNIKDTTTFDILFNKESTQIIMEFIIETSMKNFKINEYIDIDFQSENIIQEGIYNQSGSGSLTESDEKIELYADTSPNGRIAVGTTNDTIDFSNIDYLYIDWSHYTNNSNDQDVSYFAVADNLDDITRSGLEDDLDDASLRQWRYENNNFSRKTDSLDVSDITGEKNIGFGIQISSSNSQWMTLDVWDVWGEDESNEKVFNFSLDNIKS